MEDKLRSAQRGTTWFVVLFMILAAFLIPSPYVLHVLVLVVFYAILAQSWDLLFGYTGITSFCHAAFVGIGAYASALITINYGISPWLGIFFGGGFAALTSLIVGASTLRIKIGAFLATTTIAFNEVARIMIQDPLRAFTRGVMGLTGIPRFNPIQLGPIQITFGVIDKGNLLLLITAMFAVVSLFLYKLTNSKVGLTLRAIREDADAAEAIGINLTRYKVAAFLISAFIAGMVGGFYAHYFGTIDPNLLKLEQQILIMAMVVAGGRGTLYGGAWVSFILIPSLEILRPLGPGRFVVYGIALMLALRFAERGAITKLRDELSSHGVFGYFDRWIRKVTDRLPKVNIGGWLHDAFRRGQSSGDSTRL